MSKKPVTPEHVIVKATRKLAMAGDPAANVQMGDWHSDGQDVLPYNQRRALRYYRKAAETGFADGQYKAACIITELSKPGPDAFSDYLESADLAKKAASQGHVVSKIHLQTIWSVMTHSVSGNLRTDFQHASAYMDPIRCAALANDIFSFLHDLSQKPVVEAAPTAKA
jgi:TPR repeat protein